MLFPVSREKGRRATRTDSSNATHAGGNSSDVAWSSGSTWTYKTPPASDTGWFDLGKGSVPPQVIPPNSGLHGDRAEVITRIDGIRRPKGSADQSTWRTLETMIRPSSLTDFQTFTATSVTYASTATTTGPIFVGEDKNGNPGTLTHDGTAKANLYSEGTVREAPRRRTNGAKKYDKNSSPTALCKLNNCNPVQFSSFQSTITTVSGAAAAGGITHPERTTRMGMSGHGLQRRCLEARVPGERDDPHLILQALFTEGQQRHDDVAGLRRQQRSGMRDCDVVQRAEQRCDLPPRPTFSPRHQGGAGDPVASSPATSCFPAATRRAA